LGAGEAELTIVILVEILRVATLDERELI